MSAGVNMLSVAHFSWRGSWADRVAPLVRDTLATDQGHFKGLRYIRYWGRAEGERRRRPPKGAS